MKRQAVDMRDFRLPHKGTVHQHLSEIYKNHDHIIDCIKMASLRDKSLFVTKKKWERESENLKSVKMQAKVSELNTLKHLRCSIASN